MVVLQFANLLYFKKKLFSQTPQKGSVGVKKLPDELKRRKKKKNSTKPKVVLHLDTATEPSLRNFFKFRTKPAELITKPV